MTRGPTWTPAETALLVRMVASSATRNEVVAAFPGRTRAAICGKLDRLRGKAKRERTTEPKRERLQPPPAIDRDPCPRCGTRRDRGCPCPPTRGLTSRA